MRHRVDAEEPASHQAFRINVRSQITPIFRIGVIIKLTNYDYGHLNAGPHVVFFVLNLVAVLGALMMFKLQTILG